MPNTTRTEIAVIGIDIGKNSFHVVGHDERGSIVLRQKWSRGQVETRSYPGHLANRGEIAQRPGKHAFFGVAP